jgi:hypothetical protein
LKDDIFLWELLVDLERLQQRLRAMTVAQLRGRWKRIEERLEEPLRSLGEAFFGELREPAQALEICPSELQEFLALERPADDSDDMEWRQWIGARHECSMAVLHAEKDNEKLCELLDNSSLDLVKSREFILQRDLLWDELDSRGERPPGHEQAPQDAENQDGSNAGAGEMGEPGARKIAPAHPRENVGDLAQRVGKNIKEKVSETGKNVAGSAAKASGKAIWKMATSAFKYTTKGPSKPEVPVAPRRRRRRRRGAADSESEETLELIEKLHELKERGILSQDEFESKKSDLLNRL